jgi:glycosyltransferase involved in cell wall biosynthesis
MKILLLTRPICPPWDEASKNFAYTLASKVEGAEIHLLTYGKINNLPENVIQEYIYSSSKWSWGQKIRAYLFLVKELFIKRGRNINILHSFFTPTKLNVFALKILIGRKKIKTIQTLATLRDDLYTDEHIKQIIHADLIITYSDYAKEKLKKMGFENIKRIYPGIDIEKYSPAPKNQELMKKFETSENDFVINYTGEYVRLGDMDDIIDVFSELVKGNDKLKLHLAVRVKNEKDARKKKEIIKKLKKENILDRVAFFDNGGYVMEDVYNLCDISIFPARTMSGKFDIPFAVIEAMACGKPVIASNIERLRYFLDDSNSILINPGDCAALKEKILELYRNPEKRTELGSAGKEHVIRNFDIMKVMKEYEEVYKNL